MRFEIISQPDRSWLQDAWRDLQARADCSFFQSWHWIGAWIEALGQTPPVLIGRRNSTIVLLATLTPFRRREPPFFADAAFLNGTGIHAIDIITIEYNGFLIDRDGAAETDHAAMSFLLGGPRLAGKRLGELHLRGIASGQEPDSQGWLVSRPGRRPSYRIDLDALRASGRNYLDTLSANTRQQIRRSARLYEAQGELRLRRARNPEEQQEFVAGLRELHQATWIARGDRGSYGWPFFTRFHDILCARGFEDGSIELLRLDSGARAIAYIYNFLWRGEALFYQSGLVREDDAKLKPGMVAHTLAIEDHLARGSRTYDFMAGENRYKASLGTRGPDIQYLLYQRPRLPARIETGLRALRRRFRPAPEYTD